MERFSQLGDGIDGVLIAHDPLGWREPQALVNQGQVFTPAWRQIDCNHTARLAHTSDRQ
ncbi:MAG: hypothetical protein IPL79_13150 [Myxococcales bacterium]|nr:hypothetical protein [Myxococcales bacterium]